MKLSILVGVRVADEDDRIAHLHFVGLQDAIAVVVVPAQYRTIPLAVERVSLDELDEAIFRRTQSFGEFEELVGVH